MKKWILTAAAAGALAAGGAASAQDLGGILTNILGYGAPTASAHDTVQGSYRDEYGRLWVVDGAGHHTMVASAGTGAAVDPYGRPLNGVQANGRYYGNNGYYRDSDGDGVVDAQDRRPYDARRR